MLTALKREEGMEWLTDVPDTCLRQAIRALFDAYDRFFKKISKYPTLKDRTDKKSCTFQDVVFKDGKIKLPKLGYIKVKWSRNFTGDIKSATVSCDKSGKYFISFIEKCNDQLFPLTGKSIGIDVGIKDFAILSDGTKIENPKYLKRTKKALRRSQRAFNRSVKGSKRREKKRIRVAKIHAKVADTRRDYQHKISTHLVKNYDVIVMEDLRIKYMMQNHKLAGSLADVAIYEFTRQLEYKCNWYGKTFIKVSPNYTSRDCSKCGHRHEQKMHLKIRTWTCSNCNSTHDRDINAAVNILQKGMKELIPMGNGKSTNTDILALAPGGDSISETSVGEVLICDQVTCNQQHEVAVAQ
jgi:putative transposase